MNKRFDEVVEAFNDIKNQLANVGKGGDPQSVDSVDDEGRLDGGDADVDEHTEVGDANIGDHPVGGDSGKDHQHECGGVSSGVDQLEGGVARHGKFQDKVNIIEHKRTFIFFSLDFKTLDFFFQS